MKSTTLGRLARQLSLHRDQQDADAIDSALRDAAQPGGTNLWVLLFAILIASVGLNVNSTAVIIGAMLISPLMGPIVGMGYAAAVGDLKLMRAAGRSLAMFTAISLIASTLYFLASPLKVAHSELLARTSPTLWDVLIALFGGAAGMVAQTRRAFNNVVPGVAIATALMPPLCTAGFGIASGRWDMTLGALYLFTINGVFIGAATLGMSKLLRLPARGHVAEEDRARQRVVIAAMLTVMAVPSVWLGWRFVQEQVFANAATVAAREMQAEPDSTVLSYAVDAEARRLDLYVASSIDDAHVQAQAQARLAHQGVKDANVRLRHTSDGISDLRLRDARQQINATMLGYVRDADARLRAVEQVLAIGPGSMPATAASGPLGAASGVTAGAATQRPHTDIERLAAEVQAQYPQVVALAQGFGRQVAGQPPAVSDAMLVMLTTRSPLSASDREQIRRWLAARYGRDVIVSEREQR